jgi:hypothetical protein
VVGCRRKPSRSDRLAVLVVIGALLVGGVIGVAAGIVRQPDVLSDVTVQTSALTFRSARPVTLPPVQANRIDILALGQLTLGGAPVAFKRSLSLVASGTGPLTLAGWKLDPSTRLSIRKLPNGKRSYKFGLRGSSIAPLEVIPGGSFDVVADRGRSLCNPSPCDAESKTPTDISVAIEGGAVTVTVDLADTENWSLDAPVPISALAFDYSDPKDDKSPERLTGLIGGSVRFQGFRDPGSGFAVQSGEPLRVEFTDAAQMRGLTLASSGMAVEVTGKARCLVTDWSWFDRQDDGEPPERVGCDTLGSPSTNHLPSMFAALSQVDWVFAAVSIVGLLTSALAAFGLLKDIRS